MSVNIKLTEFDHIASSRAVKERMYRALEIAANSSCRQKHGAILMQGSRTLAVGINSMRNDPSNMKWDDAESKPPGISVHAEVQATRSHLEVPNTTLYLVRYGVENPGTFNARIVYMHSRPCPECISYLIWKSQVKEVIYS